MIDAAANPSMILWDGQSAMGLLMQSKRAVDRHKAVAQKPFGQAASFSRRGRCNREALNPLGKRDGAPAIANVLEPVRALPIAIEEIAITQIGDAGAANAPKAGEGHCVRLILSARWSCWPPRSMGAP